jgi:hypothetical protein
VPPPTKALSTLPPMHAPPGLLGYASTDRMLAIQVRGYAPHDRARHRDRIGIKHCEDR